MMNSLNSMVKDWLTMKLSPGYLLIKLSVINTFTKLVNIIKNRINPSTSGAGDVDEHEDYTKRMG